MEGDHRMERDNGIVYEIKVLDQEEGFVRFCWLLLLLLLTWEHCRVRRLGIGIMGFRPMQSLVKCRRYLVWRCSQKYL